MQYFHYDKTFTLESGAQLPNLTIAYQTYGALNKTASNVIWVCHALTANALAAEWWPGFIGKGEVIDTDRYFVICANIIGSCYGSTGPLSDQKETGKPFYHQFPFITIRDMVMAHQLLCSYLNIQKIHVLIGGSMGGYQAIEWCCMEPERIEQLFLIATAPRESAWGIAVHTTQRMAIESDATWKEKKNDAGSHGLATARAIGMLTYRSFATYAVTQKDDADTVDHFKAESYIRYQGQKLVKRFNAFSYYTLTKAMDSHNIARHRANIEDVLHSIQQKALIIGITSDLLCPAEELKKMAALMPNAKYQEIQSLYGHDGFLIEAKQISTHVSQWLHRNSGI